MLSSKNVTSIFRVVAHECKLVYMSTLRDKLLIVTRTNTLFLLNKVLNQIIYLKNEIQREQLICEAKKSKARQCINLEITKPRKKFHIYYKDKNKLKSRFK